MSTSPFVKTSPIGTFIFFGCVTVIAVLYVHFLVPETKGRTLEEMDELFGSTGIAQDDAIRKARIESEIGLLALLGVEHTSDDKLVEAETAAHKEEINEKATEFKTEL